ncbi:hypothetical protein GCM10023152_36160 [Agromyces bauzanensis]|uniref:Uncharacterized protein n=1 Tax=Agromyces bauzanensis TaxID=1308924 RepID=A0A917PKU0_9MICO|nr:hypothetical protein GCM10011372_21400 [Agromyces bauzanensis]
MRMRQHELSTAFGSLFVLALIGQSITGPIEFNEKEASHGAPPVGWGEFITSSEFVVDVAENRQYEYLQLFLFILATIWLVQKGSPESKKPGEEGLGTDEEQLVGEHARPDSPKWAKAAD